METRVAYGKGACPELVEGYLLDKSVPIIDRPSRGREGSAGYKIL
jgi:hypothetical protein